MNRTRSDETFRFIAETLTTIYQVLELRPAKPSHRQVEDCCDDGQCHWDTCAPENNHNSLPYLDLAPALSVWAMSVAIKDLQDSRNHSPPPPKILSAVSGKSQGGRVGAR